jgi:hypothetical protein
VLEEPVCKRDFAKQVPSICLERGECRRRQVKQKPSRPVEKVAKILCKVEGIACPQGSTALIWKTLQVAESTFRRLEGAELLPAVYAGAQYVDGVTRIMGTQQKRAA